MNNTLIKNKRLPNAPSPTKPLSSLDPWEKEHIQKIKESNKDLIRGFKNNKPTMVLNENSALKWTNEKIEKLCRLWKEGYSLEKCTREVSMNKDQTALKIDQLICEGRLFKRKNNLSDEERRRVLAQLEYGINPHAITEEMKVDIKMIQDLQKQEKEVNDLS